MKRKVKEEPAPNPFHFQISTNVWKKRSKRPQIIITFRVMVPALKLREDPLSSPRFEVTGEMKKVCDDAFGVADRLISDVAKLHGGFAEHHLSKTYPRILAGSYTNIICGSIHFPLGQSKQADQFAAKLRKEVLNACRAAAVLPVCEENL